MACRTWGPPATTGSWRTSPDVHEVAELPSSKAQPPPGRRRVLRVPEDSPVASVQDLQGKRIATEAGGGRTSRWLQQQGKPHAAVESGERATEVKPPRLADGAIVEAGELGSSLKANHLRIVAEACRALPLDRQSHRAYTDPWKKQKLDDIALMLRVRDGGRGQGGTDERCRGKSSPQVLAPPRPCRNWTISSLAEDTGFHVNTILDEAVVRQIIPRLKAAEPPGIVPEYPLSKVID